MPPPSPHASRLKLGLAIGFCLLVLVLLDFEKIMYSDIRQEIEERTEIEERDHLDRAVPAKVPKEQKAEPKEPEIEPKEPEAEPK